MMDTKNIKTENRMDQIIKRLNRIRIRLLCCRYSIILGFGLAAVVGVVTNENPELIWLRVVVIPIALTTIIIALLPPKSWKNEFDAVYKSAFVRGILQKTFDNVVYDWRNGFSKQRMEKFGLCPIGNQYSTEDYLSGSYNGIAFEQADVVNLHDRKIAGQRVVDTYFAGRVFVFDAPVKQVYTVQLYSKSFIHRIKSPDGYIMDKLSMESQSFNDMFDVYAAKGTDGFFVLTPQKMEKIRQLGLKYKSIAFHFMESKIIVGINDGQLAFDGNLDHPIEYEKECRKTINECNVIIELIEMLL